MRRLITGTQSPAVILPAELAAVDARVDGFCGTEVSAETGIVSKAVILLIPPAVDKDTVITHLPDTRRWSGALSVVTAKLRISLWMHT